MIKSRLRAMPTNLPIGAEGVHGRNLKKTFAPEVETCVHCGGRMKLLALVTETENITRYLKPLGEPTEPRRANVSAPFLLSCIFNQEKLSARHLPRRRLLCAAQCEFSF
jgi:hypothetical protein